MQRHLAHIINFEGHRFRMSVAEMSDDCKSCRIMPYIIEIHSTIFHNGEIWIRRNRYGQYEVVKCKEG